MRKNEGFDLLTYSVGSISGDHIVSDLIALVDNEVPVDTYSALKDAEKQMTKVMNSEFGSYILSPSAFINASGKVVKILSESL